MLSSSPSNSQKQRTSANPQTFASLLSSLQLGQVYQIPLILEATLVGLLAVPHNLRDSLNFELIEQASSIILGTHASTVRGDM